MKIQTRSTMAFGWNVSFDLAVFPPHSQSGHFSRPFICGRNQVIFSVDLLYCVLVSCAGPFSCSSRLIISYKLVDRSRALFRFCSIFRQEDFMGATLLSLSVKAMVFLKVMYGCESWTRKKAECWRINAFELWCWRSWESLGLQGDQTSQFWRKSTLNVNWKEWCWSWTFNTLATWCKEPTHWKKPRCLERLKAKWEEGAEEDMVR